jgi:hypothetical protein
MSAAGASIFADNSGPNAPFVVLEFFMFAARRARRHKLKYNDQLFTYSNALKRLFSKMPKEEESYNKYLDTFEQVMPPYNEKNAQLSNHLAQSKALMGQQIYWMQNTLQALEDYLLHSQVQRLLQDVQLSDIINNAQAQIVLFKVERALSKNLQFVRQSIREIKSTDEAVKKWVFKTELVEKIETLQGQLQVQKDDPALIPLHRLIERQQHWMRQRLESLQNDEPEPLEPEESVPQPQLLFDRSSANIKSLDEKGLSFSFHYMNSQYGSSSDWENSYAPTFGQAGIGLYGRNYDGGGLSDLRNPGRENIAGIEFNLQQRIDHLHRQSRAMNAGLTDVSAKQTTTLTEASAEISEMQPTVADLPTLPPTTTAPSAPARPITLQRSTFQNRITRERRFFSSGRIDRHMTEEELAALKFYSSSMLSYAESFDQQNNDDLASRYLLAGQSVRRFLVGDGNQVTDESYAPLLDLDPLVDALKIAYPIPTGNLPPSEAWRTACNRFVAHSLSLVYGYDAFIDPDPQILKILGIPASDNGPPYEHQYLRAEHIQQYLILMPSWKILGTGLDREALNQAIIHAGTGKPVIAVSDDHAALVLPGTPQTSGSWGGPVPNAASFRLGSPSGSFYNRPIGYAWRAEQRGEVIFFVYDP